MLKHWRQVIKGCRGQAKANMAGHINGVAKQIQLQEQTLPILPGHYPLTKLIEHKRLLHAVITLFSSSLNHKYHVLCGHNVICDVTQRLRFDFDDQRNFSLKWWGNCQSSGLLLTFFLKMLAYNYYAGPVCVKHGYVRKPTVLVNSMCIK